MLVCVYKRKRNINWQVLQQRAKHIKLVYEPQSNEKSVHLKRNQQKLKELQAMYWENKKNFKPELSK